MGYLNFFLSALTNWGALLGSSARILQTLLYSHPCNELPEDVVLDEERICIGLEDEILHE